MKIDMYVKKGRNAGKKAGHFETTTKTYHKVIDYRNHVYRKPKDKGYEFVSDTIIEDLKKLGCKGFDFLVAYHEKSSYRIVIEFSKFLKDAVKKNDDDPQTGNHFSKFQRVYHDQEKLK